MAFLTTNVDYKFLNSWSTLVDHKNQNISKWIKTQEKTQNLWQKPEKSALLGFQGAVKASKQKACSKFWDFIFHLGFDSFEEFTIFQILKDRFSNFLNFPTSSVKSRCEKSMIKPVKTQEKLKTQGENSKSRHF